MPGADVSPEFVRKVKVVLHNLYEPGVLQKSRLRGWLGLDQAGGAALLRETLIASVEALKPDPHVPRDSRAWRSYWILFYLYVSQFSRVRVATNLALSVRQVIRDDERAVQALADYLWARYGVASGLDPDASGLPGASDELADVSPSGPSREDELAWLSQSLPPAQVAIDELAPLVVKTMGPLLKRQRVRIAVGIPAGLPYILAPRGILFEVLQNALTVAVCAVPGGEVNLRVAIGGESLLILIEPTAVQPATDAHAPDCTEGLEMTRDLLHLLNGTLEVTERQDSRLPFSLMISLPFAEHVPVLALDDNADTLELYRRHLDGTRYLFIGTRDPLEALRLTETRQPEIILLDVMLPGMDGWQVLQRLQHTSHTAKIPVVVCSILPEEQLALAMGAAQFLRKPISQSALLAALDQAVAAG